MLRTGFSFEGFFCLLLIPLRPLGASLRLSGKAEIYGLVQAFVLFKEFWPAGWTLRPGGLRSGWRPCQNVVES